MKRTNLKQILSFLFLIILLCNCTEKEKKSTSDSRLWYNQPAKKWLEALPVGNGRLGAMVFGSTDIEKIQFNEESLWAGSKINNNNPLAKKALPQLQKLLFEGKYKKANELAYKCFVGTPPQVRSYQTFGNLILKYNWKSKAKHYKRELNLHTGIASSTFEIEGNQIKQEVFASAPDNIIVVHIESSKPFDIEVSLQRKKDAHVKVTAEGDLLMAGQIIDLEDPLSGPGGAHMKFAACAQVKNKKGTLEYTSNSISGKAIKALTIKLTAATNYNLDELNYTNTISPQKACKDILNSVNEKSFAKIKTEHIADHKEMFDRVSLTFGKDSLDYLPTDKRLDRIKKGEIDNGLIATYFQYGRYLLMGSSRYPGRLPANLQGVWNNDFQAGWNSDFHTNINLQMNYWPAEVCNLSETSLILARFMQKIMIPGKVTAQEMYNARGWTMHHLTDPFGRTGVADGVWGLTPMDGPWMTCPLYRHYEFTKDATYLSSIYPTLKGAATFIMDFLIESPEGFLVTNPSYSPENIFFIPGTNRKGKSSLTYAATTDIQIIRKVFRIISEATKILDIDHQFATKVAEAAKRLPPIKIGENGTIQEWIHDYEEVVIGHRHISHLLGLYPLNQITTTTPQLFEAAKKTIERRLNNGGGHTGWSRAWIINLYARLQNGEEAWKHLQLLLAKSTENNLFDTHPPFQIDGNFGGTAGIAEMLLQSLHGEIHLLPALPKEWSQGHIIGLKARGGYEVEIEWSEGKLIQATIQSKKGGHLNIKYASRDLNVEIEPNGKYVYRTNGF